MSILKNIVTTALLLLSVSAVTAHANLIQNGGFEEGDFTGWTHSGNLDHTEVRPAHKHDGSLGAMLGAIDQDGFLSQALPTLIGQKYELTYWLYSDGKAASHFSTTVGGSVFFDQSGIPFQTYTEYTFDFIASSTSTMLQFGFFNTLGFLGLDDISVVAVNAIPEPETTGLLALGLMAVVLSRRRKQSTSTQKQRHARDD
ncbi:MAG: PEP-CTERM sorting domain-containing protein [Pseudomonadota bacterium]